MADTDLMTEKISRRNYCRRKYRCLCKKLKTDKCTGNSQILYEQKGVPSIIYVAVKDKMEQNDRGSLLLLLKFTTLPAEQYDR